MFHTNVLNILFVDVFGSLALIYSVKFSYFIEQESFVDVTMIVVSMVT
jgi:hypothetical protein